MRKSVFIFFLSFALIFNICGKKGTDSQEEEDKISVEVIVTEDGVPVQNLFVIVKAKIQGFIYTHEDVSTQTSVVNIQEDQLTTNNYGKAVFNYENKTIPDIGGIVIEQVTIKRLNDLLLEDNEEKFAEKGTTLKLEYEL